MVRSKGEAPEGVAIMPGRTLYFRLGSGDEITLGDLQFAIQKISGVLQDHS